MTETPARAAAPPPALPPGHPEVAVGRVGVLLVNLGTPEGTDYWSVRRYLKEFLSDRRVVDTNRLIWWPVLNLVILTLRPGRSGKAYEAIWNRELDESPLRTFTRAQAQKLAGRLAARSPAILVDWAMRYGQPAIGDRIAALKAAGADRIVVFPLYPQYSAATTASVMDKAFDALKTMRWQPAIRSVPPYHDHPAFIAALAASLRGHLAALDWEPEVVLASYHGLPRRYLDLGDPYHCHCQKTTRLLGEAMGWDDRRLRIAFQSRFGRQEWLKPYTEETVRALAGEGVRRIAVITPAFASDCVETLEEIAIGVREVFEECGGSHFTMVPCLNDTEPGMELLEQLALGELAGWL
jgi:ferrochelatase